MSRHICRGKTSEAAVIAKRCIKNIIGWGGRGGGGETRLLQKGAFPLGGPNEDIGSKNRQITDMARTLSTQSPSGIFSLRFDIKAPEGLLTNKRDELGGPNLFRTSPLHPASWQTPWEHMLIPGNWGYTPAPLLLTCRETAADPDPSPVQGAAAHPPPPPASWAFSQCGASPPPANKHRGPLPSPKSSQTARKMVL